MSTEKRWRIVEDGTPSADDIMFTATESVAEYIATEITAARADRGEGLAEAVLAEAEVKTFNVMGRVKSPGQTFPEILVSQRETRAMAQQSADEWTRKNGAVATYWVEED